MFDKNYYKYFLENKAKYDVYEVIALERVIKYYNDEYSLFHMCNNYKYDFKLSNLKTYEVKADVRSITTRNFYVEYYDTYNDKPSGISTSISNYYVITDTNNYYMISTRKLRKLCKKYNSILNGNKSALGYLVPVDIVITNSISI